MGQGLQRPLSSDLPRSRFGDDMISMARLFRFIFFSHAFFPSPKEPPLPYKTSHYAKICQSLPAYLFFAVCLMDDTFTVGKCCAIFLPPPPIITISCRKKKIYCRVESGLANRPAHTQEGLGILSFQFFGVALFDFLNSPNYINLSSEPALPIYRRL